MSTNNNRWGGQFYVAAQAGIEILQDVKDAVKAIKTHHEAGINLMMWFENCYTDQILPLCEKIGMKLIIDGNSISGSSEYYPKLSFDEIKEKLIEYSKSPAVIGFTNWDEPLHEEAQYVNMKKLKDLKNDVSPGMLSFINLCPSYGPYKWENGLFKEQVDTLIKVVNPEVLAFDYYVFIDNNKNADLDQSNLWKDLGYLRKCGKALDKPVWYYFLGRENPEPVHLRIQMNSGIAYGCRWLCYWTSQTSIANPKGEKAPIFEEAKRINNEVMNAGNFLFDMKPDELYQLGLDEGSATADALFCDNPVKSKLFRSLPEDKIILSSFIGKDGTIAVAGVNRQLRENLSSIVVLKKKYKISILSLETGTEIHITDNSAELPFVLAPGGLTIFILR